ncbi:MAG: LysR family transcriptional regulator [Actinophytocola sp.]|nr:LysR family transcriptional regulator [Actinophytocola sp.]
MERKQLEYFLAIASHGSFSSAAHALRIAQPSLSYAIRGLEQEVGATLFRRMGRGVRLTPAGEALVDPARQVLRDFTRVLTAAQEVTGLVSGRLDIVAVTTLAVDPLTAYVGAFRNRYPGVEFSVIDPENAAAVVDIVRRGLCEVGLTEHDVSATGLDTFDLPEQEVLAVLPPSTPPTTDALPLNDLAELNHVTTPRGTTTRNVLDSVLAMTGKPPRIAVETAHRAAIVPLVLAGAGAALLPRRLARDAAAQGAIVVQVDPPVTRQGALVWSPQNISPAAQAFVDLVKGWPNDA